MPISGKKKIDRLTVSIETARLMVEPKEEFSVGEVFLYKPFGSDKIVRLAVRECSNLVPDGVFAVKDCINYCAVEPWCCKDGNCKFSRNRMEWFIPQCHASRRKDSTDVYFEEV